MLRNHKGIVFLVLFILVLMLIGISLQGSSQEMHLTSIGVSAFIVLLTIYLKGKIKNKLIFGHIGAAMLFLFLWYMKHFTNTNVSYWAVIILIVFIWIFYFWERKRTG
ncbi:hypothetical protein PA598K_06558 [Paenibacillus sp. 598K]|uniref:hypothetical protein n=1 Tax=Paenibacillus sp. 598K TaxID=1117987 RepID=UPI000FFA1ACB|nr:hypothetical protein [Paenibacillus sp. 598K]GBF77970.1 hypothetical protein PA598K_06558 [Paenibacillus sp. 598K]